MKQILIFLITIFTIGLSSCQSDSFLTINGDFEGLMPSDTVLFTIFELPDWEQLSVDTIVVEAQNHFSLKKAIDHTTFGMISVIPSGRPRYVSSQRGVVLLARPGDILNMTGFVESMGSVKIDGGFYLDSLVAAIQDLSVENNLEREEIYLNLDKYRSEKPQQPDSVQKYISLYNKHSSPEELKELRIRLREDVNDSEYAASEYLQNLYNKTYLDLEKRLESFTPEVRKSYTGQRLEYMCRILKNIEVGSTPPEFTVTDIRGNSISLSDYKGKYLLIYHWGLCPGTIWVHPRLLELYEKYNDKGFEVLGFTPDNYEVAYQPYKNDPEIVPLLNQPWKTVVTKQEGNKFIGKEYYFSGVPILMLISPEGKTLYRGYTDVYSPLKRLLEESFGDSPH